MATVYDRVKRVVIDRLGVNEDQVNLEASYTDDLSADSLDLVELIMALEEEFSDGDKPLQISDEDAEKIRTVHHTVEFIKEKGIKDA